MSCPLQQGQSVWVVVYDYDHCRRAEIAEAIVDQTPHPMDVTVDVIWKRSGCQGYIPLNVLHRTIEGAREEVKLWREAQL